MTNNGKAPSGQQRSLNKLVASRQSLLAERDPSTKSSPDIRPVLSIYDLPKFHNVSASGVPSTRTSLEAPSFRTAFEEVAQSFGRPGSSKRQSYSTRPESKRYSHSNYGRRASGTLADASRRISREWSKDQMKRDSARLHPLPPAAQMERFLQGRLDENADVEKLAARTGAGDMSNIVSWNGIDDPERPRLWPLRKKVLSTAFLVAMTLSVTFASGVCTAAIEPSSREFRTSSTAATLSVTLNVLGFAFGSCIFGPLSELYGRKIPLFAGYLLFVLMNIPIAVVNNLASLLICRFLIGLFGSAPISIVGNALADFWPPVPRSIAMSLFSGAFFHGPLAGAIIGGGLAANPGLGWRWTAWLTLITSSFFGIVGWFVYDESFAPTILKRRAKKLRIATKNWAIHAPIEESEVKLRDVVDTYLVKPVLMLTFEPIAFLITFHMSLVYGLLYYFLIIYQYSFGVERHWPIGIRTLPLFLFMWGVMIGIIINLVFVKRRYARIVREQGQAAPETFLPLLIVGAVLTFIGLFWFGWTSNPLIIFVPQMISGVLLGIGTSLLFLQGMQYVTDVYLVHSNSAMAGNNFMRAILGAFFPLFAVPMNESIGTPWATSVFGFIALCMVPVPIILFKRGPKIRDASHFTPKFGPQVGSLAGLPDLREKQKSMGSSERSDVKRTAQAVPNSVSPSISGKTDKTSARQEEPGAAELFSTSRKEKFLSGFARR